MNDETLRVWVDEVQLPTQMWDDARQEVFQRLGVPKDIGIHISMFSIGHEVFEPGGFHNWMRLVPDDVVRRVRQTNDLQNTVLTMAEETYEALQATSDDALKSPISSPDEDPSEYIPEPASDTGYDTIETGQVAFLASQIIGQLAGNINLDQMEEARDNHDSSRSEAPDAETTVLVSQRNEQNFEDIAAVTVENGKTFFEDAWGESTLMFDKLCSADVKPEFVVPDVAFEAEGNSWGQGLSEPPEGPFSFMSTDHKNRVDFYTVANPQDVFEDCWGSLDKMMQSVGTDDYTDQYYAPVAWRLVLGV